MEARVGPARGQLSAHHMGSPAAPKGNGAGGQPGLQATHVGTPVLLLHGYYKRPEPHSPTGGGGLQKIAPLCMRGVLVHIYVITEPRCVNNLAVACLQLQLS